MPATLRLTVLAAALLLPADRPASAQAVRGQLRDTERDRPIPGGRVLLVGEAGVAVDSARSDAGGRFQLQAPAPGSYVLYFDEQGWAGVPSEQLQLEHGVTVEYDFQVPLLSAAELRRMSDIMKADRRLQRPLPELCGEPVRAWEAGLLVGVVRERGTDRPFPGARVGVAGGGGTRPTVSNHKGVYVLCNVMADARVKIVVTSPQGLADTAQVEVRAGTVSWYDLPLRARR